MEPPVKQEGQEEESGKTAEGDEAPGKNEEQAPGPFWVSH